jgi:hypothetical protein
MSIALSTQHSALSEFNISWTSCSRSAYASKCPLNGKRLFAAMVVQDQDRDRTLIR